MKTFKPQIIKLSDIGMLLTGLYFFIAVNFSYWDEQEGRYYFLICLVMILYFPVHYLLKNNLKYKKDSSINCYLLLVICSIASFYLFKRYAGNLDVLISFLKVAGIFLITFYYIDSRKKFVFVLIALSLCAPALYLFNRENVLLSRYLLQLGIQDGARLAGTVGNANQIAMISMASVWASLCLFFYVNTKVLRYFVLLSILPGIYMILLSGSRKGLISIVIIFFLVMFFHVRSRIGKAMFKKDMFKKYMFYIIAFVSLCFLFIKITDTPFGDRLVSLIQLDLYTSSSDIQRMGFLEASVKMWLESPLWGKGFNNFRNLSFHYGGKANTYAHSTLWELLANLGLIGVFLYFRMIYTLYKKLVFYLDKSKSFQDYIILKFGVFLLILVVFFNLFAVMYMDKVFIPLLSAYAGYMYSLKKYYIKENLAL